MIPVPNATQMFARYSLQNTAPCITYRLALEDAEAGRDLKFVKDDPPPAPEHAIPCTTQTETSVGTSAGHGVKVPDKSRSRKPAAQAAVSLQGHWEPKRLEDVEEKMMTDDRVTCDMCKTSISNLHRWTRAPTSVLLSAVHY